MKLKDFAETVKGVIHGDPDIDISGVSGIMDSREGDITFVSSAKYHKQASESKASCIIVKELIPDIKKSQLIISNPSFAFAKANPLTCNVADMGLLVLLSIAI